MNNHKVKCSNFEIANNKPFTLIAGPCQLESEDHAIKISNELKKITSELGINFIYKTSFDKANRTSLKGKRGLGLEKSLPTRFKDLTQAEQYRFNVKLNKLHYEMTRLSNAFRGMYVSGLRMTTERAISFGTIVLTILVFLVRIHMTNV